jgi:hypothetical protein
MKLSVQVWQGQKPGRICQLTGLDQVCGELP